MGASIGHFPAISIGFNRDVAWSNTVSTGIRFTLHELALVPGDPTSYLVDGQPEKMTAKTVKNRPGFPSPRRAASTARKVTTAP